MLKNLFRRRRAPDPLLSIKESIRDLEDTVPELNERVAMAKARVTLVRRDVEDAQARERELATTDDPVNLATTRAALGRHRRELAEAEQALVAVQREKQQFMRAKEQKIQRAKDAIVSQRSVDHQRDTVSALASMERILHAAQPPALATLVELSESADVDARQFLWDLERHDERAGNLAPEALAEAVAQLQQLLEDEERRAEEKLSALRAALTRWT